MDDDLKTLADLIRPQMYRAWNAIGADALALGVDTAGEATEMVLDADRLTTHGGPDGRAADELVSEAVAEYGWANVVDALAATDPLL